MWTWDSTQIDFSQTCWTFDGSNSCDVVSGGSRQRKIYRRKHKPYVNSDHIKKIISDITQIIEDKAPPEENIDSGYKPIKTKTPRYIPKILRDEIIEESVVNYDPLPSMEHFDIDINEAIDRHREYVKRYLKRKNNEALSLILIMSTT